MSVGRRGILSLAGQLVLADGEVEFVIDGCDGSAVCFVSSASLRDVLTWCFQTVARRVWNAAIGQFCIRRCRCCIAASIDVSACVPSRPRVRQRRHFLGGLAVVRGVLLPMERGVALWVLAEVRGVLRLPGFVLWVSMMWASKTWLSFLRLLSLRLQGDRNGLTLLPTSVVDARRMIPWLRGRCRGGVFRAVDLRVGRVCVVRVRRILFRSRFRFR